MKRQMLEGAAGAAEPGLTLMLAHRLKRIGIEEASAVERHARNQTVVESAFQHVVVFRIAVQQEQAVIDVDIADGGACLAVRAHVRQLVVLAERLAVACGADAAGDVVFLTHDVVPDAVDGMDVGAVARKGCHIGHSGIHVCGTHGVAHGLVLLNDRFVGLGILVGARGVATLVEEELGLVEVFFCRR